MPFFRNFYFIKAPQELFTTLFEANASEIASRTPITQEMANAVGSTVDHLTQQKAAYLPTISPEQRDQLAQLIQLIKDTPFNLKDWWESQPTLRNEFLSNLPHEDYANLPKVEALLEKEQFKSNFKYSGFTDAVINSLANLDRQNPELYPFIRELDKQHPEVLSASAKDLNTAGQTVLNSLDLLHDSILY